MFEYLTIFAAIISAIGAFYSIISYRRQKYILRKTYKLIAESYAKIIGKNVKDAAIDLDHLRHEMQRILTGSSESLSILSKKKIYGSIKIIVVENDSEVNVVTLLRDMSSTYSREILTHKYPLAQNTAYEYIRNNLDKADGYFLSNDLEKMEDGGYLYAGIGGRSWKERYKSVLVLPIVGEREDELIGYLTFDSREKSAFSEEGIDLAKTVGELIRAMLLKMASSTDDKFKFGPNKANSADAKSRAAD